jgi:hypothetical protein
MARRCRIRYMTLYMQLWRMMSKYVSLSSWHAVRYAMHYTISLMSYIRVVSALVFLRDQGDKADGE